MCRFGAKSPKRTRLWSNSKGIAAFLDSRPLGHLEKARLQNTLVTRHVDSKGRKRFTGKASLLKASGCLEWYYTIIAEPTPAPIFGPLGLSMCVVKMWLMHGVAARMEISAAPTSAI